MRLVSGVAAPIPTRTVVRLHFLSFPSFVFLSAEHDVLWLLGPDHLRFLRPAPPCRGRRVIFPLTGRRKDIFVSKRTAPVCRVLADGSRMTDRPLLLARGITTPSPTSGRTSSPIRAPRQHYGIPVRASETRAVPRMNPSMHSREYLQRAGVIEEPPQYLKTPHLVTATRIVLSCRALRPALELSSRFSPARSRVASRTVTTRTSDFRSSFPLRRRRRRSLSSQHALSTHPPT